MRIIDADSLMDDIKRDSKKAIDEGDKVGSFWLGYAAGLVIKQPTIQQEKAQLSKEGTTSDLISRQAVIDELRKFKPEIIPYEKARIYVEETVETMYDRIVELPTIQPETAKRIVGKSRDGMALWYQCDMCNEPVDEQDDYCRGCGRRLIDG